MRTLVIDTSTEKSVVALVDCGDTVTVMAEKRLPTGFQSSRYLLPCVEELLKKAGMTSCDLKLVIVGVGPGSYTGIRVGVVVAKGIAYAQNLPLVGVSSLCGFVPEGDGAFAAVIDGRISGAYLLQGERKGGAVVWEGESKACPIDSVEEHLSGVSYLTTPKKEKIKQRFDEIYGSDRFTWHECYPDISVLADEGYRRFQDGKATTDASVEILYLRKTQAEIERGF